MNRLRTYCFWLAFTGFTISHATADGVMRDGLGAISGGRGGTNLGHFDNGAILHDNPAGMVNVRSRELLEISVDGLLAELDYADPDNPDASAQRTPYVLPYVSMMRRTEDDMWAYGLGIFAPAGFGAKYQMSNPSFGIGGPEYTYKSFGALAKVLPALSARLTDRLSVGGTLGVAISHAELEAPFYVQSGPFAGAPTLMDVQGTGAALCWSAGLQYALTDRTMLGVTYISESRFDLNGSAAVDMGAGFDRYDLDMGLDWPQSVGAGIRHALNHGHTFSADVIWYDWSRAFDTLEMTMTDPDNPATVIKDSLALNWRDTISVRLGYEHALSPCSVLRAGYVYHRNPVPEGTLTPLIPATLEHALTTGYGRQWCHSRFDIGYQFSFGSSCGVGTSDIVGGDFDNSEMDSTAHWLFLSYQQRF